MGVIENTKEVDLSTGPNSRTIVTEKELPEVPASQVRPSASTTGTFLSSVDSITRWTASAGLLVYGLGFVILGFHDAKYGVVQFSPFRARTVLVGFVFATLVTLAAAAQHYGLAYFWPLEPIVKDNEPSRRIHRETVLAAGFIFTSFLIASFVGTFLFHSSSEYKYDAPAWHSIAAIAGYILGLMVFVAAAKTYLKKPGMAVLLSLIALAIALAAILLPGFSPNPSAYLALVLFLVGLHSLWIRREANPAKYFLDFRNWYFVLLALWLYINQVFSFLPPRWGGGQPTPVQIFQNSPVSWSSSNPMDALLLDETDQGLYVLLAPNGKKAFFVPRGNIASVFFGSKQELQGSK